MVGVWIQFIHQQLSIASDSHDGDIHESDMFILCIKYKYNVYLLNFFPRNSINNTIVIHTKKQIIANNSWLSQLYWFGKIFFAVHKLASKVSFHGQILSKDHSINPVKEARVIIL